MIDSIRLQLNADGSKKETNTMNKILVPANVDVYNHKEIVQFLECAGYEVLLEETEKPEDMFYSLSEDLYGEYFSKGMKLFLKTNTYRKHPGRKFVVGWEVEYVVGEPVKEYIVQEYRQF